MDISLRLQELLSSRKIKQVELGRAIGVSQSYINAVVHGKKVPIDTLEDICNYIGISMSEFFQPFSQEVTALPSNLQEFTALCADLEPADIEFLSNAVKYIKSLKRAPYNTAASSTPQQSALDDEPVQTVHILGDAAAGIPLNAAADPDEMIVLPSKYADANRFRTVRARGDSMEPRIHSGDIVVAAIDTPPDPGQIALVRLAGLADDEYVIKRVTLENGRYILRSDNPTYPPMTYAPEDVRACEAVRDVFPRK